MRSLRYFLKNERGDWDDVLLIIAIIFVVIMFIIIAYLTATALVVTIVLSVYYLKRMATYWTFWHKKHSTDDAQIIESIKNDKVAFWKNMVLFQWAYVIATIDLCLLLSIVPFSFEIPANPRSLVGVMVLADTISMIYLLFLCKKKKEYHENLNKGRGGTIFFVLIAILVIIVAAVFLPTVSQEDRAKKQAWNEIMIASQELPLEGNLLKEGENEYQLIIKVGSSFIAKIYAYENMPSNRWYKGHPNEIHATIAPPKTWIFNGKPYDEFFGNKGGFGSVLESKEYGISCFLHEATNWKDPFHTFAVSGVPMIKEICFTIVYRVYCHNLDCEHEENYTQQICASLK